jgi:hypothetical protein
MVDVGCWVLGGWVVGGVCWVVGWLGGWVFWCWVVVCWVLDGGW